MKIGIVGHGSEKFDREHRYKAKQFLAYLLDIYKILYEPVWVVSGRSPMGGIDVWAEDAAYQRNCQTMIYPSKTNQWEGKGGYKERNQKIADRSDIVYVVLVKEYPESYTGLRFEACYHCIDRASPYRPHAKSGGCWTGWKAKELGKPVHWIIL